MASTADCKVFLDGITKVKELNPASKWKRIRKYKDGSSILRDFENQDGVAVIIAEDNEVLSLRSFSEPSELSPEVKAGVSFENLALGLINVLKENKFLEEFIENNETAWHPADNSLIEALKKHQTVDNSINIIPELTKIKLSPIKYHDNTEADELLENLIGCFVYELDESHNVPFWDTVTYPKSTVRFDLENVFSKFEKYNGLEICEITAGGDWEEPVVFYIYWSPKDEMLKGFFPLGKANHYNELTMTAYGSEGDSPLQLSEAQLEKAEAEAEKILGEDNEKTYIKMQKVALKELFEKIAGEEEVKKVKIKP